MEQVVREAEPQRREEPREQQQLQPSSPATTANFPPSQEGGGGRGGGSAPEIALRGALGSAPESALEGALLVVHHREHPSRALLGALLRAPRFLRALPRAVSGALFQCRFLGRGCDEALFSEKKGFSVKRGEAIQ